MKKLKILTAGIDPVVGQRVVKNFYQYEYTAINTREEFEASLDSISSDSADVILCGPCMEGVPSIELAQTFRMQAPKSRLFYASVDGGAEDTAALQKNGFEQIFFLPLDQDQLGRALRKCEEHLTGQEHVNYEAVPVVDFEPKTSINFEISIFLPLNNKYVKIMRPGQQVQKSQIEKLSQHRVNSLHVKESELPKYFEYASERLKTLQKNAGDSPEQKYKLQSSVRNMFHALMASHEGSFEVGRELSEKSQKIVEQFIGAKKAFDVFRELNRLIGGHAGDQYAKSSRVSTYASLFALGTGRAKPEEIAIAALFCDVGLAKVPEPLLNKPLSLMSAEEKLEYGKHPAESLRIIQEKRMVLLSAVQEMILNHHEKIDGSGLPKGLHEAKISEGAQLLHFSFRFDELTVINSGQRRTTPLEAINQIEKEAIANPSLIHAIKNLLSPQSA